MLHEGTHNRRGALGPKCEMSPSLVLELVHLLCDDVGLWPIPVVEHADVFEHW